MGGATSQAWDMAPPISLQCFKFYCGCNEFIAAIFVAAAIFLSFMFYYSCDGGLKRLPISTGDSTAQYALCTLIQKKTEITIAGANPNPEP